MAPPSPSRLVGRLVGFVGRVWIVGQLRRFFGRIIRRLGWFIGRLGIERRL
jgi:hypothetical protein